jgi:RND family efflux transporter MFP subunit
MSQPSIRRRAALPLLALTLLLVVACAGDEEPRQARDNGKRPGMGQGHGPGMGGPPRMPEAPVAVEPASRGDLASYYSANATLEPDKSADVLARISGVILQLKAEEGDFVRQGDLLLAIEEEEYRHRLTQAEVEAENQRARFERTEKMFDTNLVSAEEFDSARSDLRTAEAALELAAYELSLARVTAPFTGRVTVRSVDLGENVSNGTPLFTLVDMRRLLARVHVPAREFRAITAGQPVKLTVDSSGDKLAGTIDLISPVIDATSGTIKVTVAITDFPATTRPGDFAEVAIETDRHIDTLLVPRIAVVSEKGEQVVFVVEEDRAVRRTVTVGYQDDRQTEILEGLGEGEPVVVQGQRALKDGQPVKILERRVDGEPLPQAPPAQSMERSADRKQGHRKPPAGRKGRDK